MTKRHISLVGQANDSNDCGFFCGVVFSIAKHSSRFQNMEMAEEDVYAARDYFLKKSESTGSPGIDWLHPVNAPLYLAGMGLKGQLEPGRNWGTGSAALSNLEELLDDSMCFGIMLVIGFHWIAIVNPLLSIGGNLPVNRLLYDPAPKALPHTWEAPLPEIASKLYLWGPRKVVRVERTL